MAVARRIARGPRLRQPTAKASGPGALVVPGGASFPPGSSVTDATGMLAALQHKTNPSQQQPQTAYPPMVPLDRSQQFWAPFGPGAPLYPAPLNAPRRDTGQAEPRRWEYDVTWNLTQNTGRLVDWSTLRQAARQVDLISQCIRVRRVEQAELEWDVTLTRRTIEANGIKSTQDKNALLEKYQHEISRLIEFWSEPDTTNGYTWSEWLEMLMQEMLVVDAVSIYPRFTYGGDLVSLELVDGATIKPLLDERGNRPHPPAPAYQQWLYGFPRGEYIDSGAGSPDWEGASGSLIYKPRYTRVESPYGYSPVEQALASAELWLRRQQWMIAEYTDGTAPRTFLKAAGIDYIPEQLRGWEDALNDFYSGSTGNRHRLRILPESLDPTLVEDAAERYKPDYDEFLVKLLCAHMDVQPQEIGFTPRNGLGGAGHGESQEAITYRKALRPTSRWLVDLMNQISYAYLGMSRDLTFQFLGMEDEDQDLADQTLDRQFRAGRVTLNETRDELGQPRYDFAEADMPMIVTQRGVVFLEGASEVEPPGELVEPVQAPPQTTPPEGPNAEPDEGEEPPAPGKPPASVGEAAKAELAAYRKWARRTHARPFEFVALSKADAEQVGVDLTRVVFKAGGGPKVGPGRVWPGWSKDLAIATHWAPRLSQALRGAINPRQLAENWLAVRKVADPAAGSGSQHWLRNQQYPVARALRLVVNNLYTEGYYVGQQAADALAMDVDPAWGDWEPGNPAAAEALIGDEMNLRELLARQDVTINSIADNRLDTLARALAGGLDEGLSVDALARELAGILDDPQWAYMVALTETTRAVSYATLQSYMDNGIEAAYWLTAEDERVCQDCADNEDAGVTPLSQPFPTGAYQPPAHPSCRCALAPAL